MLSNNNQDNNDDHRAGGRTHISPAMLPVGQLFGDCITGIKTCNDKGLVKKYRGGVGRSIWKCG